MEFQAVIFCGSGRKLEPISRPGSSKALLPVANRPLIEYAIDWCAKAMFSSVILAVTTSSLEEVQIWVAEHRKDHVDGAPLPPIEIVDVPGETGEALSILSKHITSDFVLMPCDIITDVDPETLISSYRSRSEKTLIAGFYYKNTFEKLDKKVLFPDVLLHSTENNEKFLLDAYSRQSLKDSKKLNVRMQMLWKFDQVNATTDVLYSSIYFCDRKILEIINDTDGELSVSVENHAIHKVVRDFARRTWQHRGTPGDRVSFNLVPSDSVFLRANNIPALLEANRHALGLRARTLGKTAPPKDKNAAVVGNDAIVDDTTTIGDRSSVKRSAVGAHCTIGAKCRLTGSVIQEQVTLEDDVALENCIVGGGAVIRSGSRLVNCQVEPGYEVPAGSDAKNEVLRSLSMTVGTDDEYADLYESLSDDDDDNEDDDEGESDYGSEEEDADLADSGDDFFDRS